MKPNGIGFIGASTTKSNAVFELIGETYSKDRAYRRLALTLSSVNTQLHKTYSKMKYAELAKTGIVAMVTATVGCAYEVLCFESRLQ